MSNLVWTLIVKLDLRDLLVFVVFSEMTDVAIYGVFGSSVYSEITAVLQLFKTALSLFNIGLFSNSFRSAFLSSAVNLRLSFYFITGDMISSTMIGFLVIYGAAVILFSDLFEIEGD